MTPISSQNNARVKLAKRLRGKRARQLEGRFLIENRRDLQRALGQGFAIDFALFCPEVAGQDPGFCPPSTPAFEVSPQILAQLSYRQNPSGFVALMRSQPQRGLRELESAAMDTALVLDDLRVPGNIGALMRSADAAGIDAIVLVDSALDLYNPNIIRSSTGACFADSIYHLSGREALDVFRERGFQLIAADARADAAFYEIDFRRKTALILGAEDRGLRAIWRESCDALARIPMSGRLADSLNVSVCGAIFMVEMRRQRDLAFIQPAT